MDPDAVFVELIAQLNNCELPDVQHAAADLYKWLSNGGAMPRRAEMCCLTKDGLMMLCSILERHLQHTTRGR